MSPEHGASGDIMQTCYGSCEYMDSAADKLLSPCVGVGLGPDNPLL
jgi:hypothetical protein